MRVHGTPAELLRSRVSRQFRRPVGVGAWPTHRVHAVTDLVILQHTVPLHEAPYVLRKRDDVLAELAQPSPTDSHVIHLLVLERHEPRLRHRHLSEEVAELVVRETPARVHPILPPAQGHDLRLVLKSVLLHFILDVYIAHLAATLVRPREQQLLFCFLERRCLVPTSHIDAAGRGPVSLRAPEHMQVELVGWAVRWVKRCEALVAARAPEHDHSRQDHVHRQRGPERRLAQRHVVFDGAELQPLHGKHVQLLGYRTAGKLTSRMEHLGLPHAPRCPP